MKNKHEWHDRAVDGELVYYRAILHAGRWEFYSTRKSDPDWERHELLPLEKMEVLREVMWNKHLRRRLPLKHIDYIDKLIEDLKLAESSEGANSSE
ncbi:MAG: hypothetical protein CMO61_01125 [Verrucomicrobiales bacterium]|jgi:hypothetical protein|nr:hypothetical protein [Verrucomicrobiales bacterium]|tara:strand:+ start:10349 stop:10636 length:288 start_codon:yes stop_codon:yes gene_type:complete